jgi:hypothetical protein
LVNDEMDEAAVAAGQLVASVATLRGEVEQLRSLLATRPMLARLRSFLGRIRALLAGQTGDPTTA